MVRLSLNVGLGGYRERARIQSGAQSRFVQDNDGFHQFKEPELAKELTDRFQSDQAVRQEFIDLRSSISSSRT